MKNKFKNLAIIGLSFLFSSCGVGGAVAPTGTAACDARVKDYETAITAWTTDVASVTKCQAAKTATEKLISACSLYTVAQKKVYQDQLAQWKCN